MEIHTIGIDLAKTIFHLVGVNARGEVVVRKRCPRKQLLRFTSNLRVSLIGMEARIGPAIHSESGKLAVFLLERSDESLVLR